MVKTTVIILLAIGVTWFVRLGIDGQRQMAVNSKAYCEDRGLKYLWDRNTSRSVCMFPDGSHEVVTPDVTTDYIKLKPLFENVPTYHSRIIKHEH